MAEQKAQLLDVGHKGKTRVKNMWAMSHCREDLCLRQEDENDFEIVAYVAERLLWSVLNTSWVGERKQQSCKMQLLEALQEE